MFECDVKQSKMYNILSKIDILSVIYFVYIWVYGLDLKPLTKIIEHV